MVTVTEAVQNFLSRKAKPHMAALYEAGLETQIQVGPADGHRIEGQNKYTDGTNTWAPIRIPYKAATDPEWNDPPMSYSLDHYAEGIGMTGWDFERCQSLWVGFDFDSIVGHSGSKALEDSELDRIRNVIQEVPWVRMIRSTGGYGFHLYVTFEEPVATNNHTEHAALARAVLGHVSTTTGLDLSTRVDTCGAILWIWHKKAANNSYEVLQEGIPLRKIPTNWKDHLAVVSRQSAKNRPSWAKDVEDLDSLCTKQTAIPLGDEHLKLIRWLEQSGALSWWDMDRGLLVCHTSDLYDAHKALDLRGVFQTSALGSQKGADQNCFCYPRADGGWVVRRHTKGVGEAATWKQDASGWTRAYFNVNPDFWTACTAHSGVENDKGHFVFNHGSEALAAANALGTQFELPQDLMHGRRTTLIFKAGKLSMHITKNADDNIGVRGFIAEGKLYKRTERLPAHVVDSTGDSETIQEEFDEVIRHLITGEEDAGWVKLHNDGSWIAEPSTNIANFLLGRECSNAEVRKIMGVAIDRPWKLTNSPFTEEYPGGRVWNRFGAKLAFKPSLDTDSLSISTWLGIFEHLGSGLDEAVSEHPWCKRVGITTGARYLELWVACLFQFPTAPLPYLFLYSEEQNTGKSTLHEALRLLMTRGYVRADSALDNNSGWNDELASAILCVVEETDLSQSKKAYNRMKDWVTSPELAVNQRFRTPYMVTNTTHWIQCSNKGDACPMEVGDTRVTMITVPPLPGHKHVPKAELHVRLKAEAPDFLAYMLGLEIPKSEDRLRLPVIETAEKQEAMNDVGNVVDRFVKEQCFEAKGYSIPWSEFCDKFRAWNGSELSNNKIGRLLPKTYLKGPMSSDNAKWHICNLDWTPQPDSGRNYVRKSNNLIGEE